MKAGTGVHMTPAQLRAWTSFLEASRQLEHALAKHLKSEHSMLHSEYEILVRVDGAGGRMRMGVLASRIVESHSRVSHTVARLEERGWVAREPSPEDGRGYEVVVTPLGTKELGAASKKHAELIKQFL
ncbi:MAG: MarR family transcriptional regulator, partial [Acidimicrobiia bacterium]|nr:MarR family transcriptional regulator [Acidimicrobiia bacterium]